jgi:hypothetical protein
MSETTPSGVHDPESLGEMITLPEPCVSPCTASRPIVAGLLRAYVPTFACIAASALVFLVALPVVVPSGYSLGPDWLQELESSGLLTVVLGVVLGSLALSFRKPPLMPQALLHLGLLVVLFGAAANLLQRHLGVLALEPGRTTNRFESTSGPRLLPFSLQLHGKPLPPIESPPASPPIIPTKLARRGSSGTYPFPGRLLVQWPARALSVRLPVRVGEAPLLVPPGETPTPSNAFRITFVRLVPDFVMDPATHEISQRSDQPANPALLVRETGPGYTLERWLFAKFPELDMHQEAEHAAKTSPLRLRYESDATESPAPPDSIAATTESEPDVLEAWSRSAQKTASAPEHDRPTPGPLLVSIMDRGSACLTNQLDRHHPICFGGYRFQTLAPDPQRPGVTLVNVEQPVGGAWVSSGAGLAVIASMFTRRSIQRRGADLPA